MGSGIKFRAWDLENNVMYGPVPLEHADIIFNWTKKAMMPLQYICADDRDGREIYVGDIVKVLPEYGDKFLIENNPWVIKRKGPKYVLLKILNTMGDVTVRELPNTWDLEIIGNIYENLELLGEGVNNG